MLKNRKGITLVALVVTIVVLLILAGVSINLVLGNNGIIAKAKETKTKQAEASKNDLKGMNSLIEQMESTLNGGSNDNKEDDGLGKLVNDMGTLPEDTTPYFPSSDFKRREKTNTENGLVIEDTEGNEYVWVVVPKSLYNNTDYNSNNAKKPSSSTDYANIEYCLQQYTATYRKGTRYSDTHKADTENVGWLTSDEYTELKNSMLKSVYENGGFYVGRYEAGIDTTTGTNRTSIESQVDGKYPVPTTAPVTKADAYPYTYVTRTQAQNLASNVNSGTKTSSLMFGVQWDLVLAFMHNKGNIADSTLTSNSTTIGNYKDNSWTIKNANAKYSDNKGRTFTACPNPFKKESNSSILLTTGADSSFSVQNIYDVAGNVWEWILENTSSTDLPCASRGGCFSSTGSDSPTIYFIVPTDGSNYSHGFRVSLF